MEIKLKRPNVFFPEAWPRNVNCFLVLVAVALGLEIFLINGNIGLNFADEGYLWYGAEAVFRGKVPIRDFESYDPGRYYWAALWFHLWRPGIIPLRLSEAFARIAGVFFGLLAAKRITLNRWELAAISLVLALWIFPDYKAFDCAIPMAAVYLGVKLLERPERVSYFVSGIFISLCGFIGRNHGLYVLVAFSALGLIAAWEKKEKFSFFIFAVGGMACGLLPFLALFIFAPGFSSNLIHTVQVELERKTTNLELPVPWPWRFHFEAGLSLWNAGPFIVGLLFAILPLFYLFRGFLFLRNRRKLKGSGPLLLSCLAVGAPYLHYAFSRADLVHLAVAVSPFWIGFFSQTSVPWFRRLLIGLGVVLSLFSIGIQSGLEAYLSRPKSSWIECAFGPDLIYLDPNSARIIGNFRKLFQKLGPNQRWLVYPHLPGLYPALGLESPIWGIYCVFPPAEREQRTWIGEMEKNQIQWAFIDNWRIDDREDLSFAMSQPIFKEYLRNHFRIVADPLVPPGCFLFHRRPSMEIRSDPTKP